ncbi:MAG: hypothetical protein HC904_16845 [Blastochloris sp.]|nr:hypothetical protein [Blastochloris sp.]
MAKRGDTGGHHNDGQEDASKGKYDPPHEHPLGFYDDKEIEDRKAYKEGWRHTKDQDDSSSSSGGCFLTTACVVHAGLDDNCEELMVLRSFRDNVLLKTSTGRRLVEEYYRIAPPIVEEIERSGRSTEILMAMWPRIQNVVMLLKEARYHSALAQYQTMVELTRNEIEC